MSNLTPKQEKFAQLYVETGNASEAYRLAYDSKAKPESVSVEASKLLKGPKISLRVQELRDELEEKSLWKRLDSIRVLSEIARNGERQSDQINAVKAINAMQGYEAPTRVDHTTAGQPITKIERVIIDPTHAADDSDSNA